MANGSSMGAASHPGARRVLVVDDDEAIRHLLQRVLAEIYEVHTAAGAEAAEEILRTKSIDVVLCDHRMPGTQGIDFLARLKRTHPGVMRILVTGHTDPAMMLEAINNGAVFRYLVKPLSPGSIRQTVAEAMVAAAAPPAPLPGTAAGRSPSPTLHDRLHAARVLVFVAGGLAITLVAAAVLGILALVALYFLKSELGIDLFPDAHLQDFLPGATPAP